MTTDTLTEDQETEAILAAGLKRIETGIGHRLQALEQNTAEGPPIGSRGEIGPLDAGGFGGEPHPLVATGAANFGDMLERTIKGHSTAGAVAEYQQDRGLEVNEFGFDLLAAGMEAAMSSYSVTGDGERVQAPTVPYVPESPLMVPAAVDRRSVPVGVYAVPVIGDLTPATAATVGTPQAGRAVVETITALTPDVLHTGPVTIGWDTRATVPGVMRDAAVAIMTAAVAGADKQVIDALLAVTPAPTATTDVVTYASLLAAVYGRIDGRYASKLDELSLITGPETYALAAALYRGNSDNTHALRALGNDGVEVQATRHIPEPADSGAGEHDQQGIVSRIGPDEMRHVGTVQAIWDKIEIEDILTESDSSQVKLTCAILAKTAVVRSAIYSRQSFHLGA